VLRVFELHTERKPVVARFFAYPLAGLLGVFSAFLMMTVKFEEIAAFRFDPLSDDPIAVLVLKDRFLIAGEGVGPLEIKDHDPKALAKFLRGMRREHPERDAVLVDIGDGVRYDYAIGLADFCKQLGFKVNIR